MVAPWVLGGILLDSLLAGFGSLLLKRGSSSFSVSVRGTLGNPRLLGGLVAYGSAAMIYVVLLKFEQLSVLYPLGATTYIWSALLARRYLGEDVNTWKVCGIMAIIAGVALVGLAG